MKGRTMTVATRLTISFGTVCLLLLLVIGAGVLKLNDLNAKIREITQTDLPALLAAADVVIKTDQLAIASRDVLLSDDAVDRQERQAFVAATQSEIAGIIEQMRGFAAGSAAAGAILTDIEARRKTYIEAMPRLFDLVSARRNEEAVNHLNSQVRPALGAYQESLLQMRAHELGEINHSAQEAAAAYDSALLQMSILGLAALLIALLFAYMITRSLTRQLGGEPGYAAGIAEQIAGGDLSMQVYTRPNDRSSLLFAMRNMRMNLAHLVGDVRAGANSIATATGQIAAGNQDLSIRTEEQASALQQTASTMEEITATVRQNADNAQQANSLALAASRTAVEGGESVQRLVDTMGEVNSTAQQVAEIVTVIESIAFQTNILALNAAVEAARAGDQGRGFAVVASEVRALAQRSAASAREIKTLIDSSVTVAAQGNEQAAQVGGNMEEIVGSIERVTEIMEEISAASREQTTGIEEINVAVSQMDDVTRQNASLVEESAAAAASLQEQADALARLVATFRVAIEDEPQSPAARGARSNGDTSRTSASDRSNGRFARLPSPPEKVLAAAGRRTDAASSAGKARNGASAANSKPEQEPSGTVAASQRADKQIAHEEWAEF